MSDIRAQSRPGKFVIFCVGQDAQKVEEFRKWAATEALSIKQLKGSYKGQLEDSFITSLETFQKLKHWTLEEESVLVLREPDGWGARPAALQFRTGEPQPAGYLRACEKLRALKEESWTYDPSTDTYYICEK